MKRQLKMVLMESQWPVVPKLFSMDKECLILQRILMQSLQMLKWEELSRLDLPHHVRILILSFVLCLK